MNWCFFLFFAGVLCFNVAGSADDLRPQPQLTPEERSRPAPELFQEMVAYYRRDPRLTPAESAKAHEISLELDRRQDRATREYLADRVLNAADNTEANHAFGILCERNDGSWDKPPHPEISHATTLEVLRRYPEKRASGEPWPGIFLIISSLTRNGEADDALELLPHLKKTDDVSHTTSLLGCLATIADERAIPEIAKFKSLLDSEMKTLDEWEQSKNHARILAAQHALVFIERRVALVKGRDPPPLDVDQWSLSGYGFALRREEALLKQRRERQSAAGSSQAAEAAARRQTERASEASPLRGVSAALWWLGGLLVVGLLAGLWWQRRRS